MSGDRSETVENLATAPQPEFCGSGTDHHDGHPDPDKGD